MKRLRKAANGQIQGQEISMNLQKPVDFCPRMLYNGR